MGRKEQSQVTCTVSRYGPYVFWDLKGMGRYPRHDPDARANSMSCVFEIVRNHSRLYDAARHRYQTGERWFYPSSLHVDKIERMFLSALRKVLQENNIKCVIKAKGLATRGSKQAWRFSTSSYLIYAPKSGILAKLIGWDNLEQDAWRRLYRAMQRPYPY